MNPHETRRLPKWAIIERWDDGEPEECIAALRPAKRDAEALARFWNSTTEDLAYSVELTADAVARLGLGDVARVL